MPEPPNWRIELARASFFLSRPVQGNTPERWWQLFTGEQPSESSANREQGRYQWSGRVPDPALGSATLRLEYNANGARVDWLLLTSPNAFVEDGKFRTFGLYKDCSSAFEQRIESWLRQVMSVRMSRVAFGAVLLYAPDDPNRLYTSMSSLLPLSEGDFSPQDFLFQVNRRRRSGVIGQESWINRLSKWSTATVSGFEVNVAANTARQIQGETVIRLEVDINSDPESSPNELPPDRVVHLFRELTGMAREIAENGDTP